MYHCNKCNTDHKTISNLRKHQWSDHKETFAAMFKANKKKWSPEQRSRFKATMAAKKNNGNNVTAEQLLEKLKMQKQFMIDIVALVEGMMKP